MLYPILYRLVGFVFENVSVGLGVVPPILGVGSEKIFTQLRRAFIPYFPI